MFGYQAVSLVIFTLAANAGIAARSRAAMIQNADR